MRLLQRLAQSQPDDPPQQLPCHINQELEEAFGRYEPSALRGDRTRIDPYDAWLEQRDEASERDDLSRIRCVYHYRGSGARILKGKQ
ncbi:MAG TPA: hypothetical protein VNZ05_10560 [Solirubrobacteraceae bacterium]|jgi:hypothetical protein|nr:hypothetical protein [Solirubrobacteraceae bacterium]